MRHLTDDELIAASRVSPHAFSEVFARHWPAICGYLVRRLGSDYGEELAAEVFLRAFDGRDRYKKGNGDARPWLYGIATNLIRDRRRQERRQLKLLTRIPQAELSQEPAYNIVETGQMMNKLARMPLATREVVALSVWGDLNYEQISQALDIPIGTVRSRINRARKALATDHAKSNSLSIQST